MRKGSSLLRVFSAAFVLFLGIAGYLSADVDHDGHLCDRHLPLGVIPGADQVLCYQGYAVGYSYEHKIPLWAAYVLTDASANSVNVERRDNFRINRKIPEAFRSTLDDYRGSGYDRGHMAESGSIDFTQLANGETFLLTNIVPQLPGFNRNMFQYSGAWGALEDKTRDWVADRKRLYVVSGAVASGTNTIGKGVSIPEFFYKIFIDLRTRESLAFLLPHEEGGADSLEVFLTSIDHIEARSNIDFFALISDDQESVLEAHRGEALWEVE